MATELSFEHVEEKLDHLKRKLEYFTQVLAKQHIFIFQLAASNDGSCEQQIQVGSQELLLNDGLSSWLFYSDYEHCDQPLDLSHNLQKNDRIKVILALAKVFGINYSWDGSDEQTIKVWI